MLNKKRFAQDISIDCCLRLAQAGSESANWYGVKTPKTTGKWHQCQCNDIDVIVCFQTASANRGKQLSADVV